MEALIFSIHNTIKYLIKPRKVFPIIFCLVFIFISHVLLPRFNKHEFLFFYRWDLFSGYSSEYQELIFFKGDKKWYLSESQTTPFDRHEKLLLWYLTQQADQKNTSLLTLRKNLKEKGFHSFKICRITKKFPKYVLKEKKDGLLDDCYKF